MHAYDSLFWLLLSLTAGLSFGAFLLGILFFVNKGCKDNCGMPLIGSWGAKTKIQIASLANIKNKFKWLYKALGDVGGTYWEYAGENIDDWLFKQTEVLMKEIEENELDVELAKKVKMRIYKRLMDTGHFETAKVFAQKHYL